MGGVVVWSLAKLINTCEVESMLMQINNILDISDSVDCLGVMLLQCHILIHK